MARRRRGTFSAVLQAAVRRELLATNPMERVEWRAPTATMAIDVSTVPAPSDVPAIVDLIAALPSAGKRYAALFAAVGMAGMRPSETIALRVQDLDLPKKGWGLVSLRGATSPAPATPATAQWWRPSPSSTEPRGRRGRWPLPPGLVRRLRDHLARFEPVYGRVFTQRERPPADQHQLRPHLAARSDQALTQGPPAGWSTVYDLSHAAATMMLRANVPPAEVARRLGHSVDTLMRVYAGVFTDDRARANALIDAALVPDRSP